MLVVFMACVSAYTAKANHTQQTTAIKKENVVLGYLSFSKYNSYNLNNIQFKNLTHIVQSFMCPVSNTDPRLRYNGDEAVFNKYTELRTRTFLGFGTQLITRAHENNVKVLLGLSGGHDLHAKDLKVIFADAQLRRQFVNNVLSICEKQGYDGIDLDYEYAESAVEREGINTFISELRTAFQNSAVLSKKNPLITMACPKFDNYGQWYDFTFLSKYCDWFNIMTYAYEANFTKLGGHNCPLYPEQAAIAVNRGGSVSSSMVDYFVKQRGVAPAKLVLGLGFFGWLHHDYTALYAPKTKSTGLSYAEIHRKYLNHPDWTKKWSDEAAVPYLVNAKTKEMISYDDERSIRLKTAFAKDNGLRGVMIWELSRGFIQNATNTEPLLEAIAIENATTVKVHIIPEPVKMETGQGTFTIDQHTKIYLDPKHSILQRQGDYFQQVIESVSGFKLNTTKRMADSHIRLLIEPAKEIGEEGYHLTVNAKGITISANTDKGIFYGLQSLVQLLPVYRTNAALEIPALKVTDYPRFKWRGMMLDVSRHFFSTAAVKAYIDLLAAYKMNVFHWHLTDSEGWRLEIKKYPKLTSVGAWRKEIPGSVFYKKNQVLPADTFSYGGFYTQLQAKEIVQYAAEKNIMVVPEIEMPGHSDAAIAAYPELSCTGVQQQVRSSFGGDPDALANYCAGKEYSFEFLENVLKEVMAVFPSPYIHVGGDEVNKTGWKKCSACQQRIKKEGLKDEHELQSYFIKRIGGFLQKNNKKLIGWDEILEGGLAPDATVMSWRGEEGGIQAAKMHHPVVMAPVKPLYFNRYQADTLIVQQPLAAKFSINTLKNVYDYEPVPAALSAAQSSFVLGAQACIWTEFIYSIKDVEEMLLPRMLALSEVLWSPKEDKNWLKFNNKLYFHSKRLGAAGKNVFTAVPFLYNSMEVK